MTVWYVVEMLFAQERRSNEAKVVCEICDVLFETPSVLDAYRKAESWAEEHAKGGAFEFIGIQHVWSVDDDRPGDGTEIGGSVFEDNNPRDKRDELIPDPGEIPNIKFEANPNIPIKRLVSEAKVRQFKKVFREE
jgi:hypothetical protein